MSLTSNMNNTGIVILVDSINDDFCFVFGIKENFERKVPLNDWCPNISLHFVYNCSCNLNVNKATGGDGVPTRLFKAAASILAEPLYHIIMESILKSTVPIFWKIADIAPIPKTSSVSLDNLRPISLLAIPEKILENCIFYNILMNISSHIDL